MHSGEAIRYRRIFLGLGPECYCDTNITASRTSQMAPR
jgi:hypothetical protein